ncbi:OmpA family protein [Nitrobacter hamburgensis]|nr:OmpA family protein [Nitrobacter hamburgensis]
MFKRIAMLAIAMGLFGAIAAHADATIPSKDIANARDNALLKRYEGSFIMSYEKLAFTDFKVPLSKLEKAGNDRRDRMNNQVFKPKEEIEIEGARTRIAYLLPAERSPLEVLRNYQDVVKAAGGEVLYACKGEECGGDPERSSDGGGDGYVTVQAFQLKDDLYCKALNERTVALVHIVEPKPREQKMVVVKADEMARSIGATGRIALYGIFFDTAKADLKPESNPTLAEIAGLLNADPKLAVLIVGHTDNQGAFDYNLDLSRRRAEAVVKTLAANFRVEPRRLRAAGVGMMAPAASNDAEDGRAKNRRVEVVKLN